MVKAKGNVLSDVIYPVLMLPAMAFIAIQVYEINARSAVSNEKIYQNEKAISENREEIKVLRDKHFREEPGRENKVLPPTEVLPLDRRRLRTEE